MALIATRGVHKPPEVESLDDFLSGDAAVLRDHYAYALDVMRQSAGQPLSVAAAAAGADERGPANVGDTDHFFEHWLSDTGAFAGQPVGDIFRHGYTEAIDLALANDPPLPIESHWVSGAADTFQIHVSQGPRQVNVFVLVPPAQDAGAPDSKARRGTSFVVRAGDASEPGVEQLGGADSGIVKVPGGGGASRP